MLFFFFRKKYVAYYEKIIIKEKLMVNIFKSTCKIASSKTEVGKVISALIENNCGSELSIRIGVDESYIYEFMASDKQYYAIVDKLKEIIKVYYKDNFGKELCREP